MQVRKQQLELDMEQDHGIWSHHFIGNRWRNSIRKLLELITELSKVAGYTISTQKSLAFLHTNKEKSEREIKESILFTIATKRIKYIGINLPEETKELYPVYRKL